jgi:two-component system sensor histidine kinase UhpB
MNFSTCYENVGEITSQLVRNPGVKEPPLKLVWSFGGDQRQGTLNDEQMKKVLTQVREKERKQIGQDLHDNVNQILAAARLYAEMLKPTDARDIEIRKKTVEYIGFAIEEIRKITWDLVAPSHQHKDLIQCVTQIVEDVEFTTAMNVAFTHSKGVEKIPHDKQITLLRIVQEQIKNVVKYSQASELKIFIEVRNGKAILVIEDNGVGFDSTLCNKGIGISNMRDRVRTCNGAMDLNTTSGSGCSLKVCLPL